MCLCAVEVERGKGRNEGSGSLKWCYILSDILS